MGCKVGVGWASAHQLHHSHQPHQSANLTGTGKPMPSEVGGIGGGGGLKPTLQPTIPTNSTNPTNPLFRVIPTKVGI
ncbi:TPA: ABC transporter permease [Neisseria lactamica]